MQCFFLTIAILFLIIASLFGQWEVLNEGINLWSSSVDFIDEDIGWMAGGILLKTDDGGLTWNVIPVNNEWSIEIIDFIDELNGWAYGWANDIESNIILKTEDGGFHWILKHQQTEIWYNDIQALNDSVVFLTSDIKIIKTINGGSDWIDISPQISNAYFRSARFQDQDKGIVGGSVDASGKSNGFISRTYNGGSKWETEVLTDFNEVYDMQFNDEAVGYFLATNWEEVWESFFCRTVNLGQSWEEIYRNNFRIDSYFLSNQQNLFLSIFDSLNNNNLMKSPDGGKNWEKVFSLVNWQIPYVMLNDDNKGLIVCNLSGWRREGSNFLILTNRFSGGKWLTRRFSYPLNDVFFLDQNRGFTVGGYHIFHGPSGGDVFSTEDGGITWSPDISIQGWIGTIQFFNESIGYMLGWGWPGIIAKTADSGINWNIVYENNYDSTGFEFYGNDLFISTGDEVWTAGNFWAEESGGAGIFHSIDGGATWDFFWKYLNTETTWYDLHSIHILDDIIWTVGENGFIARIIDSDSFEIKKYPTDLPLYEVFFSDSAHGWIAGGYGSGENFQPLLLKTSDGGATWKDQEAFPYLTNDLFFRDSLQGWTVGADREGEGVIVATNNGGNSWFLQADQLPTPLNAIHFVGDYGWAVGEQGLIIKTENGGASWIDDKNEKVVPSTFRLDQNYPNPFNPKTIINYELPITNYVKLSIYNILGQEVASLVSEMQKAGSYQVEWDASGFSSGVYIYRLSTSKFVKMRKMMLIK